MQIKPDEITSILKSRIEGLETGKADLSEVGTVLSVADGIARVHGLENAMAFEMLELPHGVTGLALNLESDNVGTVLFGPWDKIVEGDTAKRTGRLREIPPGEAGRGRPNARAFDMLALPPGVTGLALSLESDNVGTVLFGPWDKIVEGDTVKRTGRLLEIPVGEAMLGRIVSPLGLPLDGKGDIATD